MTSIHIELLDQRPIQNSDGVEGIVVSWLSFSKVELSVANQISCIIVEKKIWKQIQEWKAQGKSLLQRQDRKKINECFMKSKTFHRGI